MKHVLPLALALALLPCPLAAQISLLGQGIEYTLTAQGSAGGGDYAPFWFTSNRYGLGPWQTKSAMLRASIQRSTEADSLRSWRFAYGADFATMAGHDSKLIVQQLYAEVRFKAIQLSLGQKQRPMELKDQDLSTGGMTMGINARPAPQARLELPDFWVIPRTGKWLAIKGHIAYGMFTDNEWQRQNAGAGGHRTANALLHSKAGFLRIGNTRKFPLTLTGGLEMYDQFAGEAWNVNKRADDNSGFTGDHVKMSHSLKAFWHAFAMGGSDPADGDYKNTEGNQLGSWHARLDYEGLYGLLDLSLYAEHFFEDHSQLFMQYAWKDMLWGFELRLPRGKHLTAFLYEHLRTTDQSGSIYHDATPTLPIQLSATDNYYNHGTYTGWHHAGYAIGNPLLLSPIYNNGEEIAFRNNRITANHFGLKGYIIPALAYRLLYTHEKSLGSYALPLTDPQHGHYLLLEATYTPPKTPGLSIPHD